MSFFDTVKKKINDAKEWTKKQAEESALKKKVQQEKKQEKKKEVVEKTQTLFELANTKPETQIFKSPKEKSIATFVNNATNVIKTIGTLTQPGGIPRLIAQKPSSYKQVAQLGADIARAPGRALTSVALEPTAGTLSLLKNKKVEAQYTPQTKIEKMLLGDEPIKGIFKRTEEAREYIQPTLTKFLGEDRSTGASLALAPLFVAGMTVLDLTPFGGKKNTAKIIAKSKNIDEIISLAKPILKKAKKTTDDILRIAKQLLKETNPQKVKDILLKEVSVAKKITPQISLARPKAGMAENTLARRAIESDYLSIETRQKIAADPSSYHAILKDAEIETMVKGMESSHLHTLVNNDTGKGGVYAAQELVQRYKQLGDLKSAHEVLKQAQETSVRGGQIVQAQKRWRNLFDPELKMMDIEKELKKLNLKLLPKDAERMKSAFE